MFNPKFQKKYSKETKSAMEAQRLAYEISCGPIVFQVSRLMKKYGILQILINSKDGLTMEEIVENTKLPKYACECLLQSSLTIGTILYQDGKFTCSKAGWFLANDEILDINMEFNHNVNYRGFFHLEESFLNGKPEGLIQIYGKRDNIFEEFSQLPGNVRDSWLKFNNYYSENAIYQALQMVFSGKPKTLLDVGGNIGNWALRSVEYNPDVLVTVMDLPQQIEQMKQYIAGKTGSERIFGHCGDLLDANEQIPNGFEAIWMSQLLVNFSEKECIDILSKISNSMSEDTTLYIMEMFWDRQPFETGAYILTQLSLYFAAMASGKGKFYPSDDMIRFVKSSNLSVVEIKDGIGKGHSIIKCKKSKG